MRTVARPFVQVAPREMLSFVALFDSSDCKDVEMHEHPYAK